MPVAPFICLPENATVPAWFLVKEGLWASVPLQDTPSGLYSRFEYLEAEEAATKLGVRLPTPAEIDLIRDAAIAAKCLLEPICFPDAAMCKAAGIPLGSTAEDTFRNNNMAGEPWVQEHDRRVADQLVTLGWQPGQAVFNIGKHYCAGAPKGRAWLKGWWLTGSKKYIQHGPSFPGDPGPHSETGSRDYGTTSIVVSDTDPNLTSTTPT